MRCKLFGSAFEFFEQPFDAIPISVCEVLKSEVELKQHGLDYVSRR